MKTQNWTAVGLDFIIVVVGVFVGIQVSNWNDTRLQQQSANAYIERLRADLAANQEDLDQRLVYFKKARKRNNFEFVVIHRHKNVLGKHSPELKSIFYLFKLLLRSFQYLSKQF